MPLAQETNLNAASSALQEAVSNLAVLQTLPQPELLENENH